jgi:VIT1/CCC1 family predicted Fe2+/Mn2+ transporter
MRTSTPPILSPSPPAPSCADQQQQHLGKSRQYWRDIILGVNDGLVSTFLLVAGVAGGGLSSQDILLTAISGSIAGAISMAAGEYVATKTQNEVMNGELDLEKIHVEQNLEEEMKELDGLLMKIGIPLEKIHDKDTDNKSKHDALYSWTKNENGDEEERPRHDSHAHAHAHEEHTNLRQQLKGFYRNNPVALLQIMQALEFGVVEEEARSPIKAGLLSCILFVMGSLSSVLPFIFSGDTPTTGLIAAACITITALIMVGAIKTWATRGKCLVAALENLVIAGFGGGIAYGIGILFDRLIK